MRRDVAVPLSITLALHALLVLALIFHFDLVAEMPEIKPTPRIIQAKLISMNANPVARTKPVKKPEEPASEPESAPLPPEPEPQPELPKPEPVKETPPPKPEPDHQKLLKLKQAEEAKKKVADEKAKAEAKKKEEQKKAEETKKKADAAKKKAETDKKEKDRKEKEKQDALHKQREKAARDDLAKMLSEDEQAESSNTEGELVQSYQGVIQEAVQRRWSRPPSARNGMHCVLVIQLIPTGEAVDVQILKSSGDDAFDRSAINAVKKASPFSELQALKGGADFEKNFRRFQLDFIPEDLRQ
ncbi:MAG: cell envelope integrity protein TolA [Spongiibacteraceae bacterium]